MNIDKTVFEEAVEHVGRKISQLANAVADVNAAPGADAAGGVVASLTEAVMGVTAGLFEVARAIEYFADKYEEANSQETRK